MDQARQVVNAYCACRAGVIGTCKHAAATILYINSGMTPASTSMEQKWGKPRPSQMAQYTGGQKIQTLVPAKNLLTRNPTAPLHIATDRLEVGSLFRTILEAEAKMKDTGEVRSVLNGIVDHVVEGEAHNAVSQCMSKLWEAKTSQTVYSEVELASVGGTGLVDYFIKFITVSQEVQEDIAFHTRAQATNPLWHTVRKLRITATKAHKVMTSSRNPKANTEKVMHDFVFPKDVKANAVIYGTQSEGIARESYEENVGRKVTCVGTVVCKGQNWLCCSPDGILPDMTLLEIKCPYSCRNTKILDPALQKQRLDYLCLQENGSVSLKRTHTYYTQVQVSMYVTGCSLCHLWVYSKLEQLLIEVPRDEVFLGKVVPQLEMFYFQTYLPYLVKQLPL